MTNIYDSNNAYTLSDCEISLLRASAWVNGNLDGTSDVAFGVSSLTDRGTGLIGVNFIFPFEGSDYITLCTCQYASTVLQTTQDTVNLSTTRSDFGAWNGSAALADPTEWCIAIIGNT